MPQTPPHASVQEVEFDLTDEERETVKKLAKRQGISFEEASRRIQHVAVRGEYAKTFGCLPMRSAQRH